MPMSSDPFEFAWSVAKSEEGNFDIDEYFLHRKGILDFIEGSGRNMKEHYLRNLGILPPLEQPLTEQPVVLMPDVGRDAGARREEEPPMDRGKVDEGPKDTQQEPEPKDGKAQEKTPEVKPEDKVEPPAPKPKEEVGPPAPPPVEKPPEIEDIVKPPKTRDVASEPPPKKRKKAKGVKEPKENPPPKAKDTVSEVPKSKPKTQAKPKPEPKKVETPVKETSQKGLPKIGVLTKPDELRAMVRMAEDGDEKMKKHLYNNVGSIESDFPDIYEEIQEMELFGPSFEKQDFILKDPFANPFHNPNFLDTIDIRRKMAEPMSPIIKSQPTQTQVKPDIGFDTVEGDNLSLLPASMFMGRDNSVGMDDMSLLPTGWRNE